MGQGGYSRPAGKVKSQTPEQTDSFIFLFYFFIFKDFIYLFERERDSESTSREEKEKQTSLLSREPHVGLDPRTLRS